jgi:hypothetical protein
MSEIRISSTELARSIGDILGRVRYRGDSFVVEKSGSPIAILAPYPGKPKRCIKDVLRSWVDAGERDAEFADLLEEIGRRDTPPEDPWESP